MQLPLNCLHACQSITNGRYFTFLRLRTEVAERSLVQQYWHLGQVFLACQYLCMMDWRMEAKGVTPMPVPTSTACCARKIWDVGAPNGPSMYT